ncbi:hypothetical protein SK128_001535 [Halocaridina rubra]|uniref:Cuticle protein n=1 Tax=Halocaridina rubra TaxID=373956 RepID=A0AAN8WJ87_HALRR
MKFLAIILCCTLAVRAFPQGYEYAAPSSIVEEIETPGHEDDAFQFAYAVASPEHGTYHGHQSTRDLEGQTSGSYYVLAADGNWRQTIYADRSLGFQAVSNQRPAGAPPPQASAVNYQIFVHPGATAVSASGSGPLTPEAFDFPRLGAVSRDSLTAASRPIFSVPEQAQTQLAAASSSASANVDLQSGAQRIANVQAPAAAPGPVFIKASAGAPVNLAIRAPVPGPSTIQVPPSPADFAVKHSTPLNYQS